MIFRSKGKGITKTLITIILIVVITSSVLITVLGAETTRRGVVNNELLPDTTLKVRPTPNTDKTHIGLLGLGTEVVILGEVEGKAVNPDNDIWYRIKYDSTEGYVYSRYITILSDETTSPETTAPETTAPETTAPETTAPETTSPETTAPETTAPETTAPVEPPTPEQPSIDFEAYLTEQNFPESYKPYLRELHSRYPNWIFKAQHVDYEFDYSVERQLDRSLVENSFPSSWKSKEGDAYNWETNQWVIFDGDRWVRASREIIRHYMDPRNFLGADSVFQFLDQSYDASVQNIEGVQRILAGTFMENDVTDTDGSTLNYATAIYNAGVTYKINPYVLSSMIIIEVGSQGSTIITGTYPGYENYFNYFNIGAYSANGMTPIQRGLWYASGGNDGAGTSYGRPWNTRLKAINGGAYFYSDGYVNRGQNTLYLKRFNVQGDRPFTHQYMTSVYGAAVEATKLAKGYTEELRTTPLSFYIPVYKNMPESACPIPTAEGSPNMKLLSLSVSGFELTPGFDTDVLEYMLVVPSTVNTVTINAVPMDSAAKVEGAGEFVVNTGNNVFEIKVTAGNGTTRVYKLTVAKESEQQFGELTFKDKYVPNESNIIYGIAPGMTVGTFRNELVSAGVVTVVNVSGAQKADGDIMASDDVITVSSTTGIKHADYKASVKGDLNSDGNVNISDLLKIRNRILGSDDFSAIQGYSGDIDGNGSVNISDLLKIRNHILGTNAIS